MHVASMSGAGGFARRIAIKRMHGERDASAESQVHMLLDEARLAARIQHPNVVSTLDVFEEDGEVFIVMDYLEGEALATLIKNASLTSSPIPLGIVSAVIVGVLRGLHAAHVARDQAGAPLNLVHRDVSPQNVIVGSDGVPRLIDFGIAKAFHRLHVTTEASTVKGKLPYMSPEHFRGSATALSDVYSAGIIAWEMLTCRRLFSAPSTPELIARIVQPEVPPPSSMADAVPAALDDIVLRALAVDPASRFQSAEELANAFERACPPATASDVGRWVVSLASRTLADRQALVDQFERSSSGSGSGSGSGDTASVAVLPAPTPSRARKLRSVALVGVTVLVIAVVARIASTFAPSSIPTAAEPSSPSTAAARSTSEPSATLAPLVSASPPTSPSAVPPPPSATASSPITKRPAALRSTKANCDPPYSIDANGHKLIKAECIR